MFQLPSDSVVDGKAATDLELILGIHPPGGSPQVTVGIRKGQGSDLWNPQQKVGVTESGVSAAEIILAVDHGIDIVPVEAIADRVESELQEVPAAGPAQVIDPLQRGLRIVLEIERAVVGAEWSDTGDIEERTRPHACSWDAGDSKLLQQVGSKNIGLIVVAVIGGSKAKLVDGRR